MIRDIIQHPNEAFSKVATLVTDFDDGLAELVNDMKDTMVNGSSYGLAATQIGVNKQVIVLSDLVGDEIYVLVNPMVTQYGDHVVKYEEGCLSVKDYFVEVTRFADIVVTAKTMDGEDREYEFHGPAAVNVQHQLDLLCGVTIKDKTAKLSNLKIS